MSAWLEPVIRALDSQPDPVTVFFRDDAAGWADARLFDLLDIFAEHACPIDLGLIPAAVSPSLVDHLLNRLAATAAIGVHQHGYAHRNHEPRGPSSEFGPSRSGAQQYDDIARGREILLAEFGPHLAPVFSPPWNRCTAVTAACVKRRGLRAISTARWAGTIAVEGLSECPVRVDWLAVRKGVRLPLEEWALDVAGEMAALDAPLGIMLRHAQMGDAEMRACDRFVQMLVDHPMAETVLMCEALPRMAAAVRSL